MYRFDIVLDHIDLLQRSHDEQLQIKASEQLQPVAGTFVATAPESLVDDHEPERPVLHLSPLQSKLKGNGGGQDGIGQFLFLSARLTRGVAVVLFGFVGLPVAFIGPEGIPLPYVGHPGCPAAVRFGLTGEAIQ